MCSPTGLRLLVGAFIERLNVEAEIPFTTSAKFRKKVNTVLVFNATCRGRCPHRPENLYINIKYINETIDKYVLI